MQVQDFFSWEAAQSVTGAALMVWVLMTAIKGIFVTYWSERFTSIFAFVVSVGLMEFLTYQVQPENWGNYVLAVFNGAVVALAVLKLEDTTEVSAKIKKLTRGY